MPPPHLRQRMLGQRPADLKMEPQPAQDVTITFSLTAELATAIEADRKLQGKNSTLADQITARAIVNYFARVLQQFPSDQMLAAQEDAKKQIENINQGLARSADPTLQFKANVHSK